MSGRSFLFSMIKLPGIPRVLAACALLLASSECFALESGIPGTPDVAPAVAGDRMASARIPFVRNMGQLSDSSVLFYARTFGGTVYVRDGGRIFYDFPLFEASAADPSARRPVGGSVFFETLEGAVLRQSPRGLGQVRASVNSFVGSDPARWQSGIPSYETVALGEVYEGIELSLRAHGNNVEKIFTVAPGADPAAIRMRVGGVESVRALPDGELEIMTGLGPVRFTAPIAFQECGMRNDEYGVMNTECDDHSGIKNQPSKIKNSVQVAYRVEGDVVGFDVGSYDEGRPLVIDPLVASTFIGGGNEDVVRAMCLQSSTNDPGWTNIYVAGYTASSDFPVTVGGVYRGGSYDAFISKFDDGLTNLLVSTFLGGSGDDKIYGMAFNTNDEYVIVAGYTESTNFPASVGSYGGAGDAFVARLDGGLLLDGARFLGGSDVDIAYGVGVATNDEVYVAGSTRSSDFPTNNIYGDTYMDTLQGSNDAFVAKFASDLSELQAATYIGGDADDVAHAIVVQTNDNVFITGYTSSTNFPGVAQPNAESLGNKNIFLVKFLPDLTDTNRSIFYGGEEDSVAYSVKLDRFGQVYVAGYTMSTNYPRYPSNNNTFAPGHTNTYMGAKDAVVTVWNNAINFLEYSTYFGGYGDDIARSLFIDNQAVNITGSTTSSNFPVTANSYDVTLNGASDVFLSSFDLVITNMRVSAYHGGGGDDVGYAVLQTPDTNFLYVAGSTESGNFPKTLTAYQQFPSPGCNGFVSKFVKNFSYGTVKWRFGLLGGTLQTAGPTFGKDASIYVVDQIANLFSVNIDGMGLWTNISLEAPSSTMLSFPAVANDGVIYLCSNTNLYGINGNGQVIMTRHLNTPVHASPAIGADGTIYVASIGLPTPPALLYAIDPSPPEGNVLWTNFLEDTDYVKSSPIIGTNGDIYVAGYGMINSRFYSFDTDGNTNWSQPLGRYTGGSPAIGSNGVIYVPSGGKLFAFSSGGNSLWTNNLGGVSGGTNEYSSPVIGSDGSVYIGQSNRFFKINGTTGNTNFTWVLNGQIDSSAAIGKEGSIFVGAGSNLYSLNPAGTTNWAFDARGQITLSSPLIGSDGTIYIAGGTNLFAIWGTEELADTPWPTFNHDLFRTRNSALGVVPPLAPTNITASISIHDRIRVSWNTVAAATLYEVWRSLSNNVSSAVYLGSAGGSQYDDGYVPIGYNYYYWVKSKNALGSGSLSSTGALGGRPTIPPVGVIATDGFPTNLWQSQAQVSWSECSGTHLGYHVYRSTTNNTNTASRLTALSTATTNYIDTTLPPGITNYYWVSSHNLTTTSGLSIVETGGIAPSAPTNVVVSQGTVTNWLGVTWSTSPGTDIYRLYRGTSSTFSASVECLDSNLNATAYNDVNAADSVPIPYRQYTYWVRATNNFGVSASHGAGGTGYRALHPPLTVRASDGSYSNKIAVQWEVHTTNPVSYVVFRSGTNDSSTAQQLAEIPYLDTTRTNYNDLEITRGRKYHYWVCAKNAYGTSGFGPSDSGGTAPMAPSDLSVSSGTYTDKVEVAWTASVGASGYQIWRNTNVDSSQAERVGTSAAENFDDLMSAVPGVRYYYWVKATNEFGISSFSGFDSGWRNLGAPSVITASDGTSTSEVAIAWSASENASAYDLWRGTNSDINNARELYNGVASTNYSDTSATPGEFYYYWVKARNSEFTSGFSDYDMGYRSLGYLDIGVSDFIFLPAAAAPGSHPEAVSFRLTNHSESDMLAPNYWVTNDFYLSSNSTFGDADDVWLGGCVGGVTLAAGESTVIRLSSSARSQLSLPSDASGSYYVFVHVDHVLPSTWLDINQDNNTAQRYGGAISVRETTSAPFLTGDFSGDGKADLAVYNETSGAWFVSGADGSAIISGEYWGGAGFLPVVGDYDGDGIVDMAVYHEATGTWYIRRVDGSGILWGAAWGGSGFAPVWGDYDGDGVADMCVYHEATGTWYIRTTSGDVIAWGNTWGGPTFHPVPGDFSGNGKTDLAVFVDGTYNWFIQDMDGAVVTYALSWGGPDGYQPVPGDYNGDGVADLAVYHKNSGYWFILALTGEQILWGAYWGGSEFTSVSGDFDGDGKSDLALYHETTGAWYVQSVSGNLIVWQEVLGGPGYVPLSLGQ